MTSSSRSLSAGVASLVVALAFGGASSPAHAAELRFSTTAPGSVFAIGNTLGLSKETAANGPGTRDSIGTFVTLDATTDDTPVNAANPWFAGTTASWQANGSAAWIEPRGGPGMEP